MKKIIFTLIALHYMVGQSFGQNYKKIFYKSQTIENSDVKITIEDAVSTHAGIKFRLKIINKTNDYIIYKPSESSFVIAGKQSNPEEKWLIVRPNDYEAKTIDLKGKQYLLASDYDFNISGLYKVSFSAAGVNTPDFQVPPSVNEFKAGGFTGTVLKFEKETDRTDVRFKVKYYGDKIGIFEPAKVAMKMPDGKEYVNFHSNKKPLIFALGEDENIVVAWKDIPKSSGDMQKVQMIILWRDAFKEAAPDKLPTETINILFDEETTKAKNK